MIETKDLGNIPISLPGRGVLPLKGVTILAGDIGGTKTNLAYYRATRTEMILLKEERLSSGDYGSCIEMLESFLKGEDHPPADRISLGVAGPVLQGKAELTNLSWELDSDEITKKAKVERVTLINDLEAIAWGLAGLKRSDMVTLRAGNPLIKGNMAIIAPGTGLGQAGLFWDGKLYHPFPTEGGHCDFSPRTELDIALFHFLQKEYGIVSWEKLVSGPAIYDIYRFLLEYRKGLEEPSWLKEALQNNDPSAIISDMGEEGKDERCVETMDHFVRYLARESSNLVLKMKATGGLFLGGGIPPKIISLLQKDSFYKHFMDCDRMQHLLEEVPIHIIKNDKAGLIGAAYYGAYAEE
jgi:glucokinase